MNSGEINRFRENLTDERNGAALYRAMAEAERNPKIAELYQRLAAVEERHADTWAERFARRGGRPAAVPAIVAHADVQFARATVWRGCRAP